MRRFRVTLAGLMAAIGYLGVAFAALSHPSPLWAEAWLTANLAVLAVAVLGAVYSTGGSKTFWGGFAIVAGGLLALNIFPAHPLHLVTRSPAARYYRTLSHDPGPEEEFVWALRGRGYEKWLLEPSSPGDRKGMYRVSYSYGPNISPITGMFPATALRPLGPDDYLLLCNLIFGPVLGLVGGVVARIFAGRAVAGDGP
jgi:hypothetical protein